MSAPPSARTLVVTAADENFAGLLRGLVGSLQQCAPGAYAALACFDLGLAPDTRSWAAQQGIHVTEPEWDLPVAAALREAQPHLRALTVRPFLPRYFPGYDTYLWIDCDAWVQDPAAVTAYVQAAATGAIAIVAHDHPAYRHTSGIVAWRVNRARAYFGAHSPAGSAAYTYWNAGVFALCAAAPHWAAWARCFAQGLAASGGSLCCDQTALNHALAVEQLPVASLPARYNWLCHLALPSFDPVRACFFDPLEPQSRLGVIHLTANTKDVVAHLADDPSRRKFTLRYPPGFLP